jgi:hypothetical protein
VGKDGHAIELYPRRSVDAGTLEDVRWRLTWLLGGRVVSAIVAEGPVLTVHVTAASPVTAKAAVWAALYAMGTADLFVPGADRSASRGADEPLTA